MSHVCVPDHAGNPNTWAGPTATPPSGPDLAGALPRVGFNHTNATRLANYTYWWLQPRMDCDKKDGTKGEVVGQCGVAIKDGPTIDACKAACVANPRCGGFNRAGQLRPADCSESIDYVQNQQPPEAILWLLRDTPAPPPQPDPAQLPAGSCALFGQQSKCYPAAAGYKTITINVTAVAKSPLDGGGTFTNTTSLGKCCAACAADLPRCAGWVVPNGTSTRCVLLDHTAVPTNCTKGPPPPCHRQPCKPVARPCLCPLALPLAFLYVPSCFACPLLSAPPPICLLSPAAAALPACRNLRPTICHVALRLMLGSP